MRKQKNSDEFASELIVKPVPREIRRLMAEKKRCDTPTGILQNALMDAYGIDTEDRDAYKAFMTELMLNLSKLASDGACSDTFEPDFDTFFTMVIRSINSCGEMLDLLHRNGIDYRPKWIDDEENGED